MSTLVPDEKFAVLASDETVTKVAEALKAKGHTVIIAKNSAEVVEVVTGLIPQGSRVLTNSSATVDETGLDAALNHSEKYESVRQKSYAMDRNTQGNQIKELQAAPDFAVQSAHAITEDGTIVIASATGSQFGSVSYGAGKVILVVGTHKLVNNLETAFERVEKYSYPLEDARARKVYGAPSSINKLLVIRQESAWFPGRSTVVLVKEKVGY